MTVGVWDDGLGSAAEGLGDSKLSDPSLTQNFAESSRSLSIEESFFKGHSVKNSVLLEISHFPRSSRIHNDSQGLGNIPLSKSSPDQDQCFEKGWIDSLSPYPPFVEIHRFQYFHGNFRLQGSMSFQVLEKHVQTSTAHILQYPKMVLERMVRSLPPWSYGGVLDTHIAPHRSLPSTWGFPSSAPPWGPGLYLPKPGSTGFTMKPIWGCYNCWKKFCTTWDGEHHPSIDLSIKQSKANHHGKCSWYPLPQNTRLRGSSCFAHLCAARWYDQTRTFRLTTHCFQDTGSKCSEAISLQNWRGTKSQGMTLQYFTLRLILYSQKKIQCLPSTPGILWNFQVSRTAGNCDLSFSSNTSALGRAVPGNPPRIRSATLHALNSMINKLYVMYLWYVMLYGMLYVMLVICYMFCYDVLC